MTIPIQKKVLRSVFLMLKPLARMLLRSGIGYREFAEVAKSAFVHEASVGYGIRSRVTNMSRVAIMTGLSRREVKRIRSQNDSDLLTMPMDSPASEVLSQWYTNSLFLDSSGAPRVLPLSGSDGCFADLVSQFAGDIPVGAMKTELLRVGAVEEDSGGNLRALKRNYLPPNLDDRLEMSLREIIRPALETLANNCDPERSGQLFYQRVTSACGVGKSDIPQLRELLHEELNRAEGPLDGITASFVPKTDELQSDIEAGVALYYFEMPREN